MKTYTGQDANIKISDKAHSVLGVSDFSLSLDRGIVEQELVGEIGNFSMAGSLSLEGSLTVCKLENTAGGVLLEATITGSTVTISGSCGHESLHFYFASCAVTGFDIALGDADTITEGSVDFAIMHPQLITVTALGSAKESGMVITDV